MRASAWQRFRRSPAGVLGLALVASVVTVALVGPWVAPHDPAALDPEGLSAITGMPAGPSPAHPLGADVLGRDLLSRLLYGARASLAVALLAAAVAVALGLGVGVGAGFFGGLGDAVAMRLVDVLLSLPFLLIAITVHRSVDEPGLAALALLLGGLSWTALARVVRAKTLEVRALEYVEASRALGTPPLRTLAQHVVPNVLGPVVVLGSALVARLVLYESAMSYLGLGVQPPDASLGSMVQEGEDLMAHDPRLVGWPGAFIVVTVFGFNLLGEGLRDALEPQ